MKKASNLLLASIVSASAMAGLAPAAAQAEVSFNAAVSNFYLWRGQDISNGQAVVSAGAEYSSDSGLYAGVWASSEDAGSETDLYAGYGFSAGGLDVALAYWAYLYPSDGSKSSFDRNDGSYGSEYEVTLGMGDFSATAMIDTNDTDNKYYSLNYSIGSVGLHLGMTDKAGSASDYNDMNISYAATDNLSFTLSQASGNGLAAKNEKPLLNVSYGFTF